MEKTGWNMSRKGYWRVRIILPFVSNAVLLGFSSYTYEVCLFEEAKQKPNRGGTTFSLGSVFYML
jgi:hypothetical protein